jgi:hypothetical protein
MRAAYTQAQPMTRFLLLQQNTWVSTVSVTDGGAAINADGWIQTTSTPRLSIRAGNTVGELATATLGAYHALAGVFNGAASSHQIDTTSSGAVDAGTATSTGLTIFTNGAGSPTVFAGVQVKEIIEYSRALSTTEIAQVIRYLNRIGQLGLSI